MAVVPRESKREGLREEHFHRSREVLDKAASDYGLSKHPAPGSADYVAWLKRSGLRLLLKRFEDWIVAGETYLEPSAIALREIIRGERLVKYANYMDLRNRLREAQVCWLKDSVAKDKASLAEGGRKGAMGERARKTKRWHRAVTKSAERMWQEDLNLSASRIAEALDDSGFLEELNVKQSTVRQFLGPLRPKKLAPG